MNLVMAFISCSFDSFSVFFSLFKTKTKFHENYVFRYPFSSMAISPQNSDNKKNYTGKLYGLTGMSVCGQGSGQFCGMGGSLGPFVCVCVHTPVHTCVSYIVAGKTLFLNLQLSYVFVYTIFTTVHSLCTQSLLLHNMQFVI